MDSFRPFLHRLAHGDTLVHPAIIAALLAVEPAVALLT
jgi:hypothetical protein